MKQFLILVACLSMASAAQAACPSVTLNLPLTSVDVPASTATIIDSSGATWTLSSPDFPPKTQIVTTTLTPATCGTGGPATLAPGTYHFTSGGMSWDSGCNPLGDYPMNAGNTRQEWVWNGSTLENVANPIFLVDAGNGSAGTSSIPDNWTLTASGSGWTLKNARTGNYLGVNTTACWPPSHPMPMTTSPTVWTVGP